MALTITEANKLSNDLLLAGISETIVNESPVMAQLPFIEVLGNSLRYNRENTLPTVANRAVGDTWTESAPTFTEVTAALKIIGGDADVDNFVRATRADTQDLEAVIVAAKAKAFANHFENLFLYGDATADPLAFDGLQKLMPSAQRVAMGSGSTPGALSLAKLDEAIDKVKPGRPDLILMSRATRRRISTYMRANSSPVQFLIDDFGHRTIAWDTIPIAVSDFISDAETISGGAYSAKTGGASTSVFVLRFGEGQLCGLRNGPMPQLEHWEHLETKDASRTRVKAYASLALFSTLSIACIDGISTGAVVA